MPGKTAPRYQNMKVWKRIADNNGVELQNVPGGWKFWVGGKKLKRKAAQRFWKDATEDSGDDFCSGGDSSKIHGTFQIMNDISVISDGPPWRTNQTEIVAED
ncbi:hypothetical protein RUM43_007672 [Polyplax serrata]|uniref:Uncharacterized protein n=1 Tax=Polyplax serrata TaxID=468196 RepID=A0AAN8P2A3_POLSC